MSLPASDGEWSVPVWRQYAKDNGIDLTGTSQLNKADLVGHVRKAVKAKSTVKKLKAAMKMSKGPKKAPKVKAAPKAKTAPKAPKTKTAPKAPKAKAAPIVDARIVEDEPAALTSTPKAAPSVPGATRREQILHRRKN